MYGRFTEAACEVVVLGWEEARSLKHNYIGSGHILLGLLRGDPCCSAASRALESLDISVEHTRALVVRLATFGGETPEGPIPFTPRAKRIFELALRESLSLGHNYIGPEHILLGLSRVNDGVAARVLVEFDADSEKVRNAVLQALGDKGSEARERQLSIDRSWSTVEPASWITQNASSPSEPQSDDPAVEAVASFLREVVGETYETHGYSVNIDWTDNARSIVALVDQARG